jgi:hypothetical protein
MMIFNESSNLDRKLNKIFMVSWLYISCADEATEKRDRERTISAINSATADYILVSFK